jgi:Arc/MetJ family transcription regulator
MYFINDKPFFMTKQTTSINLENLDHKLIKEAMKLSKKKSKEEMINEAVRKYIMGISQGKFLDLIGKIEWDGDLDEMRSI